jgi:hypothetical protein
MRFVDDVKLAPSTGSRPDLCGARASPSKADDVKTDCEDARLLSRIGSMTIPFMQRCF